MKILIIVFLFVCGCSFKSKSVSVDLGRNFDKETFYSNENEVAWGYTTIKQDETTGFEHFNRTVNSIVSSWMILQREIKKFESDTAISDIESSTEIATNPPPSVSP